MPSVRPGTAADLRRVKERAPHTARFWVAEDDGEILGMAGYFLPPGPPIVFSQIYDGLRDRPVLIARLAREFMKRIDRPMWCLANENETDAIRFLTWLGWKHAYTAPEGEVFLWQT